MNIEPVLARAKRNNFESLAGKSFCGPESELVRELAAQKAGAILGIQSDTGPYTVIGFEGLLVKNAAGNEMVIPFDEALPHLQKNGMKVGKGGDFEFVDFGDYGRVWMKDGPTMCAIWNIAMLMQKRVRA